MWVYWILDNYTGLLLNSVLWFLLPSLRHVWCFFFLIKRCKWAHFSEHMWQRVFTTSLPKANTEVIHIVTVGTLCDVIEPVGFYLAVHFCFWQILIHFYVHYLNPDFNKINWICSTSKRIQHYQIVFNSCFTQYLTSSDNLQPSIPKFI